MAPPCRTSPSQRPTPRRVLVRVQQDGIGITPAAAKVADLLDAATHVP